MKSCMTYCREGVVLKSSEGDEGEDAAGHAFIDVGLDRMVYCPSYLPAKARVTISLGDQPSAKFVPAYSETMVVGEVR